MTDEASFEYRAFRRARWGPVHVVVRPEAIAATVGESTVTLDLTDRRPALERQQNPFRDRFADGVPVALDGRHVATVTTVAGSPSGVIRRARQQITGDPSFVLPGMSASHRGLPHLLTLTSDAGTLVSSRRWASPLNMAVTEWSFVREHDLVAPRVAGGTRDEHIALWLVLKESQRN